MASLLKSSFAAPKKEIKKKKGEKWKLVSLLDYFVLVGKLYEVVPCRCYS